MDSRAKELAIKLLLTNETIGHMEQKVKHKSFASPADIGHLKQELLATCPGNGKTHDTP